MTDDDSPEDAEKVPRGVIRGIRDAWEGNFVTKEELKEVLKWGNGNDGE